MVEEEVVEEMVAGVMEMGEEGWVAVGEQTSFIYMFGLLSSCQCIANLREYNHPTSSSLFENLLR